jgi:hypothetical protein
VCCAIALHQALFFENVKVLFTSQGEKEAFDLIKKVRFMLMHLPTWLRVDPNPDQLGLIGFASMDSTIEALPSTERAGRSTDATLVFADELEYHPYAETNFAAIAPTIGTRGKYIGLSTADTEEITTFFKTSYRMAKEGEDGWRAVFLHALSRPDRTKKDLEILTKGMPAHRVQGEYPMTEDDALSIVKTRKFFDVDAMKGMKSQISTPIAHWLSEKHFTVSIFKQAVVGRRYCLFTDPSDGVEDPHAIVVMDSVTGEEVANSHGKIKADQIAVVHDALVRYYNNAFNCYEVNATAGGVLQTKLKEMKTPNVAATLESDGTLNKHGKVGWRTAPNQNKIFLYPLEEAIRTGGITLHSAEAIEEFTQYFVEEGGNPKHPEGGHDDFIDAWGRVFKLRNYLTTKKAEGFTYKYI